MSNTCVSNNVPERSSSGHKAVETADSRGLQNKRNCKFSIFEGQNHCDITVTIECPEGCWNRKFSQQELNPDFIRQAVEGAIFTKL